MSNAAQPVKREHEAGVLIHRSALVGELFRSWCSCGHLGAARSLEGQALYDLAEHALTLRSAYGIAGARPGA